MSRIENPQTIFETRWNSVIDSGFPNGSMQFSEQYKGKELIIRPVLFDEEHGILGVVNPFASSRLDVVVTPAERITGEGGHYNDLPPVKQQQLMYAANVLGNTMRQDTLQQTNADGEPLFPEERIRVTVEGYAMPHPHVGVKSSTVRKEGVNDYGFQIEGAPPKWPHDEASLDAMQGLLLVEGDRAVQLNRGLAALASVGSQLIIDLK